MHKLHHLEEGTAAPTPAAQTHHQLPQPDEAMSNLHVVRWPAKSNPTHPCIRPPPFPPPAESTPSPPPRREVHPRQHAAWRPAFSSTERCRQGPNVQRQHAL